jgi:hypothetical protein
MLIPRYAHVSVVLAGHCLYQIPDDHMLSGYHTTGLM